MTGSSVSRGSLHWLMTSFKRKHSKLSKNGLATRRSGFEGHSVMLIFERLLQLEQLFCYFTRSGTYYGSFQNKERDPKRDVTRQHMSRTEILPITTMIMCISFFSTIYGLFSFCFVVRVCCIVQMCFVIFFLLFSNFQMSV